MRHKRICILTSAHPVDDVRVYRKIALSLIEHFEVIWIGPDTCFFENVFVNDGILRLLVKASKGVIGRLETNFRVINRFRQLKTQIDFVYLPDPDIAFLFTHLVKTPHFRVIFDIHEVFHKGLLNRRVKGALYPVLQYLVQRAIKRVVRKTDLTIGVSSTVLNYYVSRESQSMVIRNCLPRKFAQRNEGDEKKKQDFTIVHGKNHISRGTLQVYKSLRLLKDRGIFCRVLMINQLDSAGMLKCVSTYGDITSYIELHEGLPFKEMIREMSMCHAGLIAYDRDLGIDSLPNRIFEYMALGIPSIVPNFSVELANLVVRENCGLVVDTENPIQLADAIGYLITNPQISKDLGKNGKHAFLTRHNWEVEVSPLINFLSSN